MGVDLAEPLGGLLAEERAVGMVLGAVGAGEPSKIIGFSLGQEGGGQDRGGIHLTGGSSRRSISRRCPLAARALCRPIRRALSPCRNTTGQGPPATVGEAESIPR